jgi:uncharacterized coiled-coil protein SlyX
MQNKIAQQEDNITELEERITAMTDEMNKVSTFSYIVHL